MKAVVVLWSYCGSLSTFVCLRMHNTFCRSRPASCTLAKRCHMWLFHLFYLFYLFHFWLQIGKQWKDATCGCFIFVFFFFGCRLANSKKMPYVWLALSDLTTRGGRTSMACQVSDWLKQLLTLKNYTYIVCKIHLVFWILSTPFTNIPIPYSVMHEI